MFYSSYGMFFYSHCWMFAFPEIRSFFYSSCGLFFNFHRQMSALGTIFHLTDVFPSLPLTSFVSSTNGRNKHLAKFCWVIRVSFALDYPLRIHVGWCLIVADDPLGCYMDLIVLAIFVRGMEEYSIPLVVCSSTITIRCLLVFIQLMFFLRFDCYVN